MSLRRGPRAVPLAEIGRAVSGQVVGAADTVISGVSSLESARPGELAYVEGDRFVPAALLSQASAFVVARHLPQLRHPQLVVAHARYTLVRIIEEFFTAPYRPRGIAEQVVRGADVEIGPDVSIWPFVTLGARVRLGARVTLYPGIFLGDDVVIGDDSILYPHVTVREGCTIGARVIIHSGTVIGSDGFGYLQHEGRHVKIPQLGTVVIEDDVELGANVAVDRATFGRTIVRRGTKVDNLVQIAHNVSVGEHSILVAQVGIAGSTTVGSHVMIGGQAGLSDHLEVGDRVMIAAQSGVHHNLAPGEMVAGTPAVAYNVAIRAHALLPRLPALRQQLRELEVRVKALESVTKPARKSRRPRR